MIPLLYAHGAGATPDDPPLPALRQLLGRGYEVTAPDLGPPDPQSWTATLRPLLLEAQGTILVGHSLGGSHLLKTLTELGPMAQPRAFVGLACPLWGMPGWEAEGFTLPPFALDALRALPLRLFHSRDDDVVDFDHLTAWKERLPNARLCPLDGQGHSFTGDLAPVAMAIAEL